MKSFFINFTVAQSFPGKRSLVHIAAYLTHRPIVTVALSPSADTVELLGAFEQREDGGIFTWIDSPLVQGIKEGHWVMLENAQLCRSGLTLSSSSTVLLCELFGDFIREIMGEAKKVASLVSPLI